MFILLIQIFEEKHGILLSFPETVKITLMKILSLHYKQVLCWLGVGQTLQWHALKEPTASKDTNT